MELHIFWHTLSILKQQWTIKISSPPFYIFSLVAILVGSQDQRTHFGRGPSKDHSSKVWSILAQWFLRRRFKCEKLTTDEGRSRFIAIMQIRHILIKDHIQIFSSETAEPNYTKPGRDGP
jgi:hypothetical protein